VVPTSTRCIVIHAPANQVWQWVVQLGQERAGFYSNDWLENLTFADIHNANEIRPDWQQRKQGDIVLGAGGAVYGENSYWHIPYYERGKSSICGDRSLWIPSTTEPHTCSSAPMPRPHRPRYMPLMYSRMTGSIS
jgi:hypothetical protein